MSVLEQVKTALTLAGLAVASLGMLAASFAPTLARCSPLGWSRVPRWA
jgi:hypothetical protein